MYIKLDLVKSPWFLLTLLTFYIIVAYFSTGYHNYDEHYEVIEFANYRLGKAAPDQLAWEFTAKVRPGLQPRLCFLIFKALSFISIKDVYYLAFALRIISAALFIFISQYFIKSQDTIVENKYHNSFVLLYYFLWFLPYINVRFVKFSRLSQAQVLANLKSGQGPTLVIKDGIPINTYGEESGDNLITINKTYADHLNSIPLQPDPNGLKDAFGSSLPAYWGALKSQCVTDTNSWGNYEFYRAGIPGYGTPCPTN